MRKLQPLVTQEFQQWQQRQAEDREVVAGDALERSQFPNNGELHLPGGTTFPSNGRATQDSQQLAKGTPIGDFNTDAGFTSP